MRTGFVGRVPLLGDGGVGGGASDGMTPKPRSICPGVSGRFVIGERSDRMSLREKEFRR